MLSPHFEVLEQSLQGVTLRMRLTPGKGSTDERQRFLAAVPGGPQAKLRFLAFSYAVWDQEGVLSATGPIDLEAEPGRLDQLASARSIVKRYPLGRIRDALVESIEVFPYHSAPKRPGVQGVQIFDLTFRLEFAPGAAPAGEEPDFARGFPSGYRGIFDQVLINSQALPLGAPPEEKKVGPPGRLAYFDAPSLVLETTREGFYFLPAARLAALSEEPVRPRQLALYHRRREVPLAVVRSDPAGYRFETRPDEPLSPEDGILFFAPLSESPYSPESVFYLTLTGGRLRYLSARRPERVSPGEAVSSVPERHRVEENHRLWEKQSKAKDKTQHEYWIWQAVGAERPFTHHFDLRGSPHPIPATATVRLEAILLPDVLPRQFNLRGYAVRVGEATWAAEQLRLEPLRGSSIRSRLALDLPLEMFDPDHPAIGLTLEACDSADERSLQGFSVDALVVDYERRLRLEPEGLTFSPRPEDPAWRLEWPSEIPLQSFRAIGRSATGELFHLPVRSAEEALIIERSAAAVGRSLVEVSVFPASRMPPCPAVRRSLPTDLLRAPRRADVILITHPIFKEAVEPLVALRRSQGYSVDVVSTLDIYKTFGDGSLNPEDIKEFLRYAYDHWGPPRPTYVVLVGDARWDYWGFLDLGVPNWVPTYHTSPAYSNDDWYVCLCGTDPLPELMISRISVADVTAAEVAIGKIVEYETSPQPGPWQGRVLFVSDNERIFEEECERQIRQKIPLYLQTTHLRVRDYPFIDNYFMSEDVWLEKKTKYSPEGNQAVLDELERGYLLWEYYGHGSPNVFAEQRIFFGGGSRYSDVKRLHNRPRLPVLVALTCDTIQYDYAGEVGPQWTLCMGEELLTHPDGGAVAVYGSTGRGYTTQHALLNDGFHDALFGYGFRTLGELVGLSKLLCYSEQRSAEPLEMFGLLGDGLTGLPVPLTTVPLSVKPQALVADTGSALEVLLELRGESGRLPGSPYARLAVQDAAGKLLFLREDQRGRGSRLRFRVPVPPEAAAGAGRVGAFLYPRSTGREALSSYYGGGALFEVLRKEEDSAYPAGAFPDLVVSATSIHFSPPSPRSGETIFIDVDVANRGRAPARSVQVEAYDGPPEAGGQALEDRANWTKPTLPLVPPGQTRRIRLRWDPFLNAGHQEIHVRVDPHDRTAESNKDNNSATGSLYVRKKVDLTLVEEDFELSRATDPPGLQLLAAVRNIGETTSQPFLIQVLVYETDRPDEIPEEFQILPEVTPSIPPKRRARFREPVSLPLSARRIEMVVDPDEILDEETHKNNRLFLRVEDLLAGAAQPLSATPEF